MSIVSLHFRFGAAAAALAASSAWLTSRIPAGHLGMMGAISVLPALFAVAAFLFFGSAMGVRALDSHHDAKQLREDFDAVSFRVPVGKSQGALLCGLCVLVVFGFDWRGFVHGFFRLDDFEFLRVPQQEGLMRQLLLEHGGHALPLYRIEVFALTHSFGPAAWAFNLSTLATCVALMAAGCWLLVEMRVGWLGLVVFLFVCWFWPGWSDFTAGYCGIVYYLKGAAAGLAALAALVRAAQKDDRKWLSAAFLLATASLGFGLVSAWVLAGLLLVGSALRPICRNRVPLSRMFLSGFVVLAAGYAVFLMLVFRQGDFMGPPVGPPSSPTTVLMSLLSGAGGLLFGIVVPVQFGALNSFGIIHWLEAGTLGFAFWRLTSLWPRLDGFDRRVLLALVATVLVQVVMVVVARRPLEGGYFWAPKWTAIARSTLMVLIAFVVDRSLRFSRDRISRAFGFAATLVVMGAWVATSTPVLLRAMGSPVSREHSVEMAQTRRLELARVRADILQLSTRLGERPVALPPCAQARFNEIFPCFENYPLESVVAALPPDLVRVEPHFDASAARFRAAIAGIPRLHRLYSPALD